jgi:cyclophilin family peptidyl-prolyl cis-trans isomerase
MRLLPLLLALAAVGLRAAAPDPAPLPDGLYAEFSTPRGTVIAELFYKRTPLTAANFAGLAEGAVGPKPGTPYFDGLKFHRVVPGFVVQGGDPLGTGEGGPGYQFADEFVPGLHLDAAGVLAMANSGPDTNGSQFFFTLAPTPRLNYLHSVFGRVVRGLDLLPQIQRGDTMQVKIRRVGAAAQAFKPDPLIFAGLRSRATTYAGAKTPGPSAHFDDPDKLLPTEVPRAANFNFKLANFERATGLRIVARVFAKNPPADQDARPGAFMRALATQLGVEKRGVLAAYFHADDDWRVWIGDDLVAAFLGRPATAADLGQDGPLHEKKEAFLATVKAQAAAYVTEARSARGPDQPLRPADLVKFTTDAMLDALLLRFEPKAKL